MLIQALNITSDIAIPVGRRIRITHEPKLRLIGVYTEDLQISGEWLKSNSRHFDTDTMREAWAYYATQCAALGVEL
jgi:hypothetical protein